MHSRVAQENRDLHCMRVHKVYDWVLRGIEVPHLQFSRSKGNLPAFTCSSYVWDPCELDSVETMLSDKDGHPLDPIEAGSIQCEEIAQSEGRKSVQTVGPNGDKITLEKVLLSVKGFIVIALTDQYGNECYSQPIPWSKKEIFYLCAPNGTKVNCRVTSFDSDVVIHCKDSSMGTPPMPSNFKLGSDFSQDDFSHFLSPMLDSIDLSISLCLEVIVESLVALEMNAILCHPREERNIYCPLPKRISDCQLF